MELETKRQIILSLIAALSYRIYRDDTIEDCEKYFRIKSSIGNKNFIKPEYIVALLSNAGVKTTADEICAITANGVHEKYLSPTGEAKGIGLSQIIMQVLIGN